MGKQYDQMNHDDLVKEARNRGITNPEAQEDQVLIQQLEQQQDTGQSVQ